MTTTHQPRKGTATNNNQDSSPTKKTTAEGGEETIAKKEEWKTQDLVGNRGNETYRKRTETEPKLQAFDLTIIPKS
jgi:hypothetical protein